MGLLDEASSMNDFSGSREARFPAMPRFASIHTSVPHSSPRDSLRPLRHPIGKTVDFEVFSTRLKPAPVLTGVAKVDAGPFD